MRFFVLAALVVAGYLFGTMGLDALALNLWSNATGHNVLESDYGRTIPGVLFLLGACLLGSSFTRRESSSNSREVSTARR
jgi:hypothetical protein